MLIDIKMNKILNYILKHIVIERPRSFVAYISHYLMPSIFFVRILFFSHAH